MITRVGGFYGDNFGVHRFYKDIGFNCNGAITKVVIGARNNPGQSSNPPAIQIWRNNGSGYTPSGPFIPLPYNDASIASDISTEYLRWYNLSDPVLVSEGDVLGVYHYQPTSSADSIIYYQWYNGPANFYTSDSVNSPTGYNLYPLVSVVFGKIILSVVIAILM